MKKVQQIHIASVLMSSVFLTPAAALAQAEEAASAPSGGLDVIVVTSRRREENLQETPIAVTALNSDAIQERNIQSVAEITNFAPNIQFDSVASESGGGASTQISIRGIGQNDYAITVEPGVGLYIDGVYVGKSVGSLLDAIDLESIQVLRGPQGTLFGKNTIGGAVVVTTKRPSDEPEFSIEMTNGNFDRFDVKTSFNAPINDGLRIRGSGAVQRRDGHVNRVLTGDTQGNKDAISGRLAAEIDVTDSWMATVAVDGTIIREESPGQVLLQLSEGNFFSGLHNTIAFPACDPSIPGNDARFTNINCANSQFDRTVDSLESTNTGPNQSDTDVFGASITVDGELGVFDVKSISAYRDVSVLVDQELTGSPAFFNTIGQDINLEQISQEIQFSNSAFSDRLQSIFGFFYLREDGTQVFPVRLAPVQFTSGGEIQNNSFAFFGQSTFDITDRASLTVGGRYSIENREYTPQQIVDNVTDIYEPFFAGLATATTDPVSGLPGFLVQEGLDIFPRETVTSTDREFTPAVTLDYQFTDEIFGYASYSRGFKGGGFTLRGFPPLLPGVTTTETDPNVLIPGFEPETANVYEVGFKTNPFDNRVRFNVAAFLTDYKDVQLTANAGVSAFVPVLINAGDATIWGVEVETEALITDWLRFNGGFGYLNSSYDRVSAEAAAAGTTLDSELPNSPEFSANAGVSVDFFENDNGHLSARADMSYKSMQAKTVANDPLLIQDSYAIVNASMTYELPNEHWSVTAGITNLTDEIFIISGVANGGIGYAQAVVSRPREWFVRLRYNY